MRDNFQYLSIPVKLITFWQVKFTKSDLVMGVRTTSLLLFSQTRKGEVCYTKIVLFYSNFVWGQKDPMCHKKFSVVIFLWLPQTNIYIFTSWTALKKRRNWPSLLQRRVILKTTDFSDSREEENLTERDFLEEYTDLEGREAVPGWVWGFN